MLRVIDDFGSDEAAERGFLKELYRLARPIFNADDSITEQWQPNRSAGEWLGFERGTERFSGGYDNDKAWFYAELPDSVQNKWPSDAFKYAFHGASRYLVYLLRNTWSRLGDYYNTHELGPYTIIVHLIQYRSTASPEVTRRLWCGEQYDHALITALAPASYLDSHDGSLRGTDVDALQAFVPKDNRWHNIDERHFHIQAGELGQIVTNDTIRASLHRVQRVYHSRYNPVERWSMAAFLMPAFTAQVVSSSVLTRNPRYCAAEPCVYSPWHRRAFAMYSRK